MTQSIGQIGKRLDLRVRQGADFGPYSIILENADGSLADLAGSSAQAQLRRGFDSPDPPAADFDISIDVAAASIRMSLPAAATAVLNAGRNTASPNSRYVWDLAVIWADGRVQALLYGDVRVLRRISR